MVTIESAVEEFLLASRANGIKPATIRWYQGRLGQMVDVLGRLELGEVSARHLRQYVVSLRERGERYSSPQAQRPAVAGGLSPETIHGHIRAIRCLFTWCTDEYALSVNPAARLPLPRLANRAPKAATLDDVRRLLKVTGDDLGGQRDRALLLFLVDTGCRAAGALTLKLGDLDLDGCRAIVLEKADRARVVPFLGATQQAISAWLAARPVRSPYVFTSLRAPARPLTLAGLHGVLKRLKRRSVVTGRVNPHSFRHMFAREYLNAGGDLASLSRLLGHSTTTVTSDYYAIFDEDELAQKHGQFSPVRKLYETNTTR